MPPSRLILLFLFTVIFDVFAQPLPERRAISGRVSMTQNKPVLGAQVTIKRKEAQSVAAFWGAIVKSDVRGEFSVPHGEEGDYSIEVSAPGYEVWKSNYTLSEYSPPLRIILQRKVSLTFTLLNEAGQPVANRFPSVFGYRTKAGVFQFDPQSGVGLGFTSRTNAKGTAVLLNQSEGVYHQFHVLVPGVGYGVWKGKVQVVEGGTQHFEIQLENNYNFSALRVEVLETPSDSQQPPRPLGRACIWLHTAVTEQPESLAQWLFGQTNCMTEDGTGVATFRNLLPGLYEIGVSCPDSCKDGSPLPGSPTVKTVRIEENKEAIVRFRLPAPAQDLPTVEILLRDEQGRPVANRDFAFTCYAVNEWAGLLNDLQARGVPTVNGRRARTNENGKVTFYPFWAATWRITATELDAVVPFHGEATIEVAPEGATGTIEVSLRPIEEAE